MKTPYLHLAPDIVIAARVALAFVALAFFSLPFYFAVAGLALTVVVIAMDALDGYLARRLGVADDLGAVLDITGDRIVEHVFWIYFAVAGVVPVWVPLVIVTRSFAVDTVRGMALTTGQTAFGDKTMMRSPLTRFLVSSRFMRTVYGVAKVAAFVLLAALIAGDKAGVAGVDLPEGSLRTLQPVAFGVVLATVALNLVRGLPVLWDSMPLLRQRQAES
jgi:CDP-diacylglycerol---glycerol-3-phosphate 3-phosphatidyltransferase